MRGGMTPFNGDRNDVGFIAQTLDPDWGGTVSAARDGRTVTVHFLATRATWSGSDVVAALDPEFWPTGDERILIAAGRDTATPIAIRIGTDGTVTVVVASSAHHGVSGDVTFIR